MLRVALFCMNFGILVLVMESFVWDTKLESKNTPQKQEKPCLYVQASALNVRKNPNTQAQILQALPKGTQVCEYFGIENGFLQLADGYVAIEYLSLQQQKAEQPKAASAPLPKTKILLTSTQKTPKQDDLQLARLAMLHKDYAKAKTLALKINQQNPKNLESWEIFTKALYLEGNKSEAMLILQKILAKNPNGELVGLLEQMRKGERI